MRLLFIYGFLFINLANCLVQAVAAQDKKPDEEYRNEIVLPNGIAFQDHVKIWHSDLFNDSKWKDLQKKIGFIFPINSLIDQIKTNAKGESFHAIYKTNHLGLRQMPEEGKKRKYHLILAGDSNTFGFGVNDNACSVFLIGEKYPNYQGYNFGHGGGGPNNTLALMESFPWADHVSQEDGKMIYIFYYDWMMPRVIGSKFFIKTEFGAGNPWYALDNKQEIYRAGTFNDKFSSKFYKFINFIDFGSWVGDLPKRSIDDNQLATKVFLKMKSLYLKKFPKGEFIVALSLYNASEKKYALEMGQRLEKSGVKVVMIHEDLRDVSKYHLLDWHFNEEGQKFVANSLIEKIKF